MAGAAWDWLYEQANSSKRPPQKPDKETPKEPPEAPEVVTDKSDTPYDGPSWDDLKKKYGGDEERMWMAVEQGSLPPDVIPEYREAKKQQNQ
jgi:hypothetical protein